MLRRACFSCAVALVLLAGIAPAVAPADAQEDPELGRPTAFIGSGEAIGVQVLGNTVPPQVIAEVLNAKSPWATSQFEAGSTANANASLFDPGGLVTGGASLLCQAGFPCGQIPGFPPSYPLTARASNPLAVDAVAQINGDAVALGPVTTTAGEAKAHAGRDKVTSNATVQGNALGSGVSVLARIGNATASNEVSFGGDGALTSTAIASVNDIVVLGALHIDSIQARSTSIARPDGTVSNDVHLDISGASLAGVPIAIGNDGVNIGGSPSGGDLLSGLGAALSPLLQAFRGTIRTLGVTDTTDSSGATGSANGVVLDLYPNLDVIAGISPRVTVILAFAGSHAYAYNSSSAGGPFGGGPGSSGTLGSSGSFVPGTPGAPGVNLPGYSAAPPGNSDSLIEELVSGLLSGAAAERLKFFYLAWTLSMIGCALGSRLKPARIGVPTNPGGTHAA